jgi:hypothetical protein
MFYNISSISLTHWFHENTLTLWLDSWCNHFIQHTFDIIEPLVLISNYCFGFKTMKTLCLCKFLSRLTIDFINCLNGIVFFNICDSDLNDHMRRRLYIGK